MLSDPNWEENIDMAQYWVSNDDIERYLFVSDAWDGESREIMDRRIQWKYYEPDERMEKSQFFRTAAILTDIASQLNVYSFIGYTSRQQG